MMSTVHIEMPPPIGVLAGLAIIACSLAILGVEIYKAQALLEDWDRTRDDADKGARGAERHEEELEQIKAHLASADTRPIDTVEQLPARVVGGLRTGPTPVRGRHSA